MKQKVENSLSNIVRKYYEEHGNVISNEELEKYILCEKKINTSIATIRSTSYRIKKEVNGTIKRKKSEMSLQNTIKAYVESRETVTLDEVVNYVRKKGYKNSRKSIYCNLYQVLEKMGKKIEKRGKGETLKDALRVYLDSTESINRSEVIQYVRNKGYKNSENTVYSTLYKVFHEYYSKKRR